MGTALSIVEKLEWRLKGRVERENDSEIDKIKRLVESENASCSVQLFGDSMDCSPPGSSVHGILQARMLEWVAISFSRGSS